MTGRYQVQGWACGMGWVNTRTDQVGGAPTGQHQRPEEAERFARALLARDQAWMDGARAVRVVDRDQGLVQWEGRA
jgi:hypothetical protein